MKHITMHGSKWKDKGFLGLLITGVWTDSLQGKSCACCIQN